MGKNLPPRVFAKGRWYYYVTAAGEKRVWTRLSKLTDGLPALHLALAKLLNDDIAADRVLALVTKWQTNVMPSHSPKTQRDDMARCKVIANAFVEFKVSEVQAPDVATFLAPFKTKPRTYNAYRSLLRELLRYGIEQGHRTENPVDHIRTMTVRARTRYITDSELRRIKVNAIYGEDGKRTRSGLMLCALIDMAYLTGQAIGDLLDLRWERDTDEPQAPHIQSRGIWFARKKLRKTTQDEVLIEWSDKLRDAVRRLKEIKLARPGASDWVFITQDGKPYTYWGASTAWRRAVQRSGIKGVHFHDLRAKALTDKEERDGMQAARTMGSHSTEQQTADYVRQKKAKKTGATR